MEVYQYWAFLGTLYLGILTYQDYKHNMIVDDRHNYFMLGVTSALYPYVITDVMKIIGLIIYLAILGIVLYRFKLIGEADKKTILWAFTGAGIININYLLWITMIFSITILTYMMLKKFMMKDEPAPFYPPLLLGFIAFCYFFKVY